MDLLLVAGTGGSVVLEEPDGVGTIQLKDLLSAISTLRSNMGSLFVLVNRIQKTCTDVQENVTVLGATLEFLAGATSEKLTWLHSELNDEAMDRKAFADQTMHLLKLAKSQLSQDINRNKALTTDAMEDLAEGMEALDVDVQVLADAIDTLHSKGTAADPDLEHEPLIQTCAALKIENGGVSPPEATRHIVGSRLHIACLPGFFRIGPEIVVCGNSGKYCGADRQIGIDIGDETTGANRFECLDPTQLDGPICHPCLNTDCFTCASNGTLCTACMDANKVVVGRLASIDDETQAGGFRSGDNAVGLCTSLDQTPNSTDASSSVSPSAFTTCKAMSDAGLLSDPVTHVKLVTPWQHKVVDATCIVTSTGVHTMIKCNDLLEGASCKRSFQVTDANTCTEFGYLHAPFKSLEHYKAAYNIWHSKEMWRYWKTVGGLYKVSDALTDDIGSCLMQSEAVANGTAGAAGAGATSCASHWKSVGGGAWWVSNTPQLEPYAVVGFNCYIGLKAGAGPAFNKLGTLVTPDYQKNMQNGHKCPTSIGSLYMCQSAVY
jgi:hypothetical protein